MAHADIAARPSVDGPLFDPVLRAARDSARRLAELLRSEHTRLDVFLLAVAAFDRDRSWMLLGYPSLFGFLHHGLGLSHAAAFHRKTAVALIQRFPEVLEPLRNGHLRIASVVDLARAMNEGNRAEVLARFLAGTGWRDRFGDGTGLRP